jgi:hypothetical protein
MPPRSSNWLSPATSNGMATRKDVRPESKCRIIVWIPKDLHARLTQMILLNQRSMTHYVVRGLKLVLAQSAREWPREYFDTAAEREAFTRSVARYKRGTVSITTAVL